MKKSDFSKGHVKLGGRRKGQPNKITGDVKKAIQFAFEEIGGISNLSNWARDNRTEFYTKVWVKIIPKDINVNSQTLEDLLGMVNDNRD